MSVRYPYDYSVFRLEVLQGSPAKANVAKAGLAAAGITHGGWKEVDNASVSFSGNYRPTSPPADNDVNDDNDPDPVIIIDTETISFILPDIGEDTRSPLKPNDRVRVRFGSKVRFEGTVDTAGRLRLFDASHVNGLRVDFSGTAVGPYADALNKKIPHGPLPKESAYKRITRFGIVVSNWSSAYPNPTVD